MITKDKFEELKAAESAFNVADNSRDDAQIDYIAAVASLEASHSARAAAWDVREAARAAYDAAAYADRCAD